MDSAWHITHWNIVLHSLTPFIFDSLSSETLQKSHILTEMESLQEIM